MNTLTRLVDETLADPLAAARAHAAGGGRVIGYATCNVPVEFIDAAGAFPLHLPWHVDASTPHADRYMESLFERSLRSAFDRWLAGDFAFVEAVVLPRTHDTAQRVYYYADELLRTGVIAGPRPLLFDLQKIPREASVAYSIDAARALCATLGVDAGRLPAAIERANARRAAFDSLARGLAAGSVAPSFGARVLRAALHANPADFDAALAEFVARLATGSNAASGPRVVLAGSVPPDERLHAAIEAGGGVLDAEATLMGPARHGPAIRCGGDPVADVVRAYRSGVPSLRDFDGWLAQLLDRVEARPDGVVLWLAEEDEALVWQVPKLRERAAAANVPMLELTRQDWRATGEILGRIEAFTRGVARR